MIEAAYPLDIAAGILECQPKKIMTEWAKGSIRIVLDFGDKPTYRHQLTGVKSPWHGRISAPATTSYFSGELINPSFSDNPEDVARGDGKLSKDIPEFYRDYAQSGFYFEGCYHGWYQRVERLHDEAGKTNYLQIESHVYGYWVVPYEEFSRLRVQDKFKMKPYSNDPASSAVTLITAHAPSPKELRITETEMQIMRELLGKRPTKSQGQTPATAGVIAPQEHKHVERFALGRERILAAALYVAHHHKSEIGKSFKSHAECIEKYGYLFWKNEAAPDHERITKVLSDATRRPEEWKILGGNANKKK